MQKTDLRQPGRPAALRWVVLFVALAGWETVAAAPAGADPVRTTPESLGIDAAPLASLDADIASAKFPLVDSLLVMRCGEVVFDRRYPHDYAATYGKEAHTKGPLNARLTGRYNYFDPAWHPYYHGTDEHTMQSVSKTVTSAIIGIAMTRGDFKAPLSTPVLHYFDEIKVKNIDARKRRMTLRDLLTMTSGMDWNEDLPYDDPANPSDLMEAADDWVQFVIDRPMKEEPGTVFAYSSGATELLAYIFKRETGADIEHYANEGFKYGYQWWLLPHGEPARLAWAARGMGGQRLLVFPEDHLIVVSTAWHILNEASIEFDVVRRLLPGVHPHQCGSHSG